MLQDSDLMDVIVTFTKNLIGLVKINLFNVEDKKFVLAHQKITRVI